MEPQEFIKTVLPANAICAIVGIKKGKVNQALRPLGEIDKYIKRGLDAEMDMYFGCAGYATPTTRTKANVAAAKSFWVDLDCGEGTPYKEKQDGFNAIKSVCKLGVPKPFVVDSGRGLHLYFILDRELDPVEWSAYAPRVVEYLTKKGLQIKDRGCSTDIARILRVPDTFNYKDAENPAPVKFLVVGVTIVWPDFKSILDAETAPVPVIPPKTQVAKYAPDPMTAMLAGNIESSFGQIVKSNECAQINWCVDNVVHLPEPMWRGVLSIIKRCKNSDAIAHKFSAFDPRYDPKQTQDKMDATKGPFTCGWFKANAADPDLCVGCAFSKRTNGSSSPIVLGHVLAKPQAPAIAKPIENLNLIQMEPTILPDLPFPYQRGISGGIYKKGMKNPDGTVSDPTVIYPYNLDITNRITDPKRGDTLYLTLELPHVPAKEILMPVTSLHSMDKMKEILGFNGVIAGKKQMEEIAHYLVTVGTHIQATKAAEQAHSQMGWVEDRSGFVLGRFQFKSDGMHRCPPSAESEKVAQAMVQKGTIEKWNEIANRLGEQRYAQHALVLLVHAGSILNFYTGEDPIWVHLVSTESGSGKTTSMEIANAMWGAPDLLMLTRDDTRNSVDKRRTALGSITTTIDEITNRTPEELSTMAYSMSVHREKMRLNQNSTEMFNSLYRDNNLISNGNDFPSEKISIFKTNAAGEMARLIELVFVEMKESAEGIAHFKTIHQHYGHVGPMIADWVVKNEHTLEARVQKWRQRVQDRFKGRANERNWVGATATMFCILEILQKDLYLLEAFDADFLWETWLKILFNARAKTKSYTLDHPGLLGEFMNENRLNILMPDANTSLMGATKVEQEVRHKLVGRWEKTNNRLWLSQKDLKEYCAKRQHSFTDLLAHCENDPHFLGVVSKNLSAGTSMASGHIKTWAFNTSNGELVPHLPNASN